MTRDGRINGSPFPWAEADFFWGKEIISRIPGKMFLGEWWWKALYCKALDHQIVALQLIRLISILEWKAFNLVAIILLRKG